MHAWIFSCLSIASLDGKEHLSEVVFKCSCQIFVVSTGSNNHQRVLQGCPLSPKWCCAVKETRVVINRQLAPPSWQCSSTFLALDSEFLFWQKISLLSFSRLFTLLIWLPATSDCSPNPKDHWKKSDFRQEMTLWLKWQSSWEKCGVPRRLLWGRLGFQRSRYPCPPPPTPRPKVG